MTDDTAAPTRTLVPSPRPRVRNPWQNGLGVTGFLVLLAAAVDFMVPPAATPQLDGSSIVNFPSLYLQYGLGLALVMVGGALVAAWGVTGAREWRLEHPGT